MTRPPSSNGVPKEVDVPSAPQTTVVPMDAHITLVVVEYLRSMVRICHPTAGPNLVDLNAQLLAKRAADNLLERSGK